MKGKEPEKAFRICSQRKKAEGESEGKKVDHQSYTYKIQFESKTANEEIIRLIVDSGITDSLHYILIGCQ